MDVLFIGVFLSRSRGVIAPPDENATEEGESTEKFFDYSCRISTGLAFLESGQQEKEKIMNGKEFLTAAVTMAAMMTLYRESHAASGVVELEIPGMNALTAAAISDFSANPCPETVAAIRTSVASNYDGVVVRKAEKRDELQAEADALVVELGRMISTNAPFAQISRQEKLIEERQSLVDDMTEHHKGTGV
jgi:hypothetical protein